jgi:hypothetical protein
MNKLLIILIVIMLMFFGRNLITTHLIKPKAVTTETPSAIPGSALPVAHSNNTDFHCDGRVYCSQMRSCEEAAFFLKNCPGVKMDGDGDGVPCEDQWCR